MFQLKRAHLYVILGILIGAWPLSRAEAQIQINEVAVAAGIGSDNFNSSSAHGLGAIWIDYDNDGFPDLFVPNGSSLPSHLYHNEGNGTFSNQDGLLPAGLIGEPTGAMFADYDNDGDPDLLISGATGSGRLTHIYRNDSQSGGEIAFVNLGLNLPGVEFGAVRWGDYDNDGDLDFVLSGATDSGRISEVYRNDNGLFSPALAGLIAVSKGHASWGDYDNDGDLDLILTGQQAENDRIGKVYQNITTLSNTRPEAPSSLGATVAEDQVILDWEAGNDAETPSAGLHYNLRIGRTPGGIDVVSPTSLADGHNRVPQPGNVRQNTSWRISGLGNGQYYWNVQSLDASFAGSPFAAEQSFVITDSQIPVELTTFDAVLESGKTVLSWETASEINNAGFEVQRATDNGSFQQIGFVEGKGTTTDPQLYRFDDPSLPFGAEQLYYRLKQIDFDGACDYSPVVSIEMTSPEALALLPNYPNPFNPTTEINFHLAAQGNVHIAVYDMMGRQVDTLVDQNMTAGSYTASWNGRDAAGNQVASGVYLYRIVAGNFVAAKVMTLLK